MSLIKRLSDGEAPLWVIAVLAVVGLVVLIYFGRQAIVGREGDPGPPKKVYPRMYDIREEAARMRNAKESGTSKNGP